ncbi:hypothetical protein GA0115253_106861 [Streptomyces sp. Termitarium-T10T-6]|nr:hypothetical protein GA0115253_106861 [Streptomyces sp. Termitarium-T10T-6]
MVPLPGPQRLEQPPLPPEDPRRGRQGTPLRRLPADRHGQRTAAETRPGDRRRPAHPRRTRRPPGELRSAARQKTPARQRPSRTRGPPRPDGVPRRLAGRTRHVRPAEAPRHLLHPGPAVGLRPRTPRHRHARLPQGPRTLGDGGDRGARGQAPDRRHRPDRGRARHGPHLPPGLRHLRGPRTVHRRRRSHRTLEIPQPGEIRRRLPAPDAPPLGRLPGAEPRGVRRQLLHLLRAAGRRLRSRHHHPDPLEEERPADRRRTGPQRRHLAGARPTHHRRSHVRRTSRPVHAPLSRLRARGHDDDAPLRRAARSRHEARPHHGHRPHA